MEKWEPCYADGRDVNGRVTGAEAWLTAQPPQGAPCGRGCQAPGPASTGELHEALVGLVGALRAGTGSRAA